MKLKIVALAAVCMTAGLAQAQTVTLSGKLGFGYQSSKAFGSGTKTNGLTVTDGNFALTAVEDLGGGLKATAYMDVQSRGRDTAIKGRDAYIKLDGGFGSVLIGSIESANAIIDLASAGAPTMGLDTENTLDVGLGNVDILQYTSPSFGGATVYAALADATTKLGMESASTTGDAVKLGVNYSVGAFTMNADYAQIKQNGPLVTTTNFDGKRYAVSGMYDFGMVAVGAGYQRFKEVGAEAIKQYELGVSAPVTSALTVGATYGHNSQTGTATVKGYELGANYALSKRTGVRMAYRHEKATGGIAGSDYQIRLLHSF